MKKQFLITFVVFSIIICMVGCGKSENSKESQTLKIGVMPDVDSIPLIIAQHEGYFEKEGIHVELEHFKSAIDRDTALQTGNLDGAISDMLAVVFFNDNGFDVKITSKTDGSFKLIAGKNSAISSVEEVIGKNIGISRNTIIEYLTDRILTSSNIPVNSIEKVAIPKIPTRLEMLKNEKLDLATLPEPLASIAIASGGIMLSGSDTLNINPGVMIFTQDSINLKEKEIQGFYNAYNKATTYLQTENMESYMDVLIKEAGFPPVVKDTLILPNYSKSHMPSKNELVDVLKWLKSKDLTENDYSFDALSDSKFIK
jgi:NitT/TauT family transport system substrate-binding protein